MRIATLIAGLMFAIGGLTAIIASITGARWFFGTRNARMVTGKMSATGARVFYGLLGVGILWMAVKVMSGLN